MNELEELTLNAMEQEPQSCLDELATTGPIHTSIALVVAHPDDEVIAIGGTIARFSRLTLIHATDGAPRQFEPSAQIPTREDLARLRVAEADAAVKASLAKPIRRLRYDLMDGEVLDSLLPFIESLSSDLMFSNVVMTHPFEGGHIDHDACSLAVQYTCDRIKRLTGHAPIRLEFASYFGQRGKVRAAQFRPREDAKEIELELSPAAQQRREMAFASHRSQEGNLRFFSVSKECFRVAPVYDFSILPANPLYSEVEQARWLQRVGELQAFRHA